MVSFGERFGYQKPITDLAQEAMPDSLRAGLWDVCKASYFHDIRAASSRLIYSSSFEKITNEIWFNLFRKPTDTRGQYPREALANLRKYVMEEPFVKIYEFVEFLAQRKDDHKTTEFAKMCNRVFERERAAFRFADKVLVRISNEEELDEISSALAQEDTQAVGEHIKRAAELYSDRNSPDYRNSIKESISAVEASVRFVTGKKTVGVSRPLKGIADIFEIHPAMRDGFEKLYAFTSDANGIRHSLLEEENLTQEDARYMLVSCSAFANYLIARKAKDSKQ